MDNHTREENGREISKNIKTPADYSSERDKIREKYEKKTPKKKKRRISVASAAITVSFLVVIILIVFLIKLLADLEDKGTKKEEETTQVDTEVISSRVDTATDEDTTEATRTSTFIPDDASADEIRYANLHMGDSWYNSDIYSAVCKDVEDEYFEDVCFIGDSRTMGLLEYSVLPRWHGYYKVGSTAAAACVERAYTIDGDYYTNILNIIESVDYDIFYVGYGTNELGYGDSAKFIEELKVVIDKIRDCHPGAIIYVENVLPMGQYYSDNNPGFSNSRALSYNEALRRMCQEYGDLIYLDIASCMRDPETGAAISEYIGDGLHYTPDGCKEIMKFIRGAVVEKK